MRNLILVAFTEPVTVGMEFPRTDWPLHITLLRFDIEPSEDDDVADLIAELAGPPVAASLGIELTVGPDAGFGHQGSVPVSLVEPSEQLQGLHEALHDAVGQLGGRVATPHYVLEHYRPHISHHDGKRPWPGETATLDRIALVDMAPDGNHTIRRVLTLWTLQEA